MCRKQLIFLFFLMIPLVSAIDFMPSQSGIAVGVGNYFPSGRFQNGSMDIGVSIFRPILQNITTNITPSYQVSGGAISVEVDALRESAPQGGEMTANITIKNMAFKVVQGQSLLTYYLVSPNGTRYSENSTVIEELHSGKSNYQVRLKLPYNAKMSEWEVKAELRPFIQEKTVIEGKDTFRVYFGYWWLLLLPFIYLYFRKRRKKKREKKTDTPTDTVADIANS